MSYEFYLDKMLLPVAPSKVQTKIQNQNKTITLINEGEVNLIKAPGLTEISFDALLPMHDYPFARYQKINALESRKYSNKASLFKTSNSQGTNSGFMYPNYYLDGLESLKVNMKPFYFKIVRNDMFGTNILVTLEDYSIIEDAKDGSDFTVSIKLKQYVEYGTTKKTYLQGTGIKKSNKTTKKTTTKDTSGTQYYTVKKGDTMWAIAKKYLGDGSKCWNLAKLNGLKNPNMIKIGQKLKIQEVKPSTASGAGYSTSSKTRRPASKSSSISTTNSNKTSTSNTSNKTSSKKNTSIVTEAVIVDPLNYNSNKSTGSGASGSLTLGLTGTKGYDSSKTKVSEKGVAGISTYLN